MEIFVIVLVALFLRADLNQKTPKHGNPVVISAPRNNGGR